jgi:uncharacterized protein YbjQ (UPF0145 family)
MIISNTDFIPGREIVDILGMVRGNTIQAKHIGKDVVAGFRNFVGGEIKEYTQMLSEARELALKRMEDKAQSMGADAVINIRFTTSAVMASAAEILCYGTAVKLR